MKKIISAFLVLVLAFACLVPAFAEDAEHPTIYITGAQTCKLVKADGSQLYPLVDDVEAMDVIKEALVPCLKKLVKVSNKLRKHGIDVRHILFKTISKRTG